MKRTPALALLVSLCASCSLLAPYDPCAVPGQCIEPEDDYLACHDGFDNDRNGVSDCGDPACGDWCLEVSPEECSDGLDNDQDGLLDCGDADCLLMELCGTTLFADEFDGTSLDTSLWTEYTFDSAGSTGAIQVGGGELRLEVNPGTYGWAAGRGVATTEAVDFFDGRLYVRVRLRAEENGMHEPLIIALVPDLDERTALGRCGSFNPDCSCDAAGGGCCRLSRRALTVEVRPLGYVRSCFFAGSVSCMPAQASITRVCTPDSIMGDPPPEASDHYEVLIAVDSERLVVERDGERVADVANDYGRWPSRLVLFTWTDQPQYAADGTIDSIEVALQTLATEVPLPLVDDDFAEGSGGWSAVGNSGCSASGGVLEIRWEGELGGGPTQCTTGAGASPGASFDLSFDMYPMTVSWNSYFGLGLLDVNANFEADKAWIGVVQDDQGYHFLTQACSASELSSPLAVSPELSWHRARLFYDATLGGALASVVDANGSFEYVAILDDDTCPTLPYLGASSVGTVRSFGNSAGWIDNVVLRELRD